MDYVDWEEIEKINEVIESEYLSSLNPKKQKINSLHRQIEEKQSDISDEKNRLGCIFFLATPAFLVLGYYPSFIITAIFGGLFHIQFGMGHFIFAFILDVIFAMLLVFGDIYRVMIAKKNLETELDLESNSFSKSIKQINNRKDARIHEAGRIKDLLKEREKIYELLINSQL